MGLSPASLFVLCHVNDCKLSLKEYHLAKHLFSSPPTPPPLHRDLPKFPLSIVFWWPPTREKVCIKMVDESSLSLGKGLKHPCLGFCFFVWGAWIAAHRPSPRSSWDGGKTSELNSGSHLGTFGPQGTLGSLEIFLSRLWGVEATGIWRVEPGDAAERPTMRRSCPHPTPDKKGLLSPKYQ